MSRYFCYACKSENGEYNMAAYCSFCYGSQRGESLRLRRALEDILAHAEPRQRFSKPVARAILQVVVAKAKEALL